MADQDTVSLLWGPEAKTIWQTRTQCPCWGDQRRRQYGRPGHGVLVVGTRGEDNMADQDTVSLLWGLEAKELYENSNIMTVICDTILYKRYYTNIAEYYPSENIG
jgi:hypothetical protein